MAFYTAAPALDARWWKLLKSSGMNRWGCQRAGVLNSHAALAGWVPSSLLLLIIFEDRDGPHAAAFNIGRTFTRACCPDLLNQVVRSCARRKNALWRGPRVAAVGKPTDLVSRTRQAGRKPQGLASQPA